MELERLIDESTRRSLRSGVIVGSLEQGDIQAWRGIPYARPPLGHLRWRAPQAAEPWAGVRHAVQHGPMAPQYAEVLSGLPPRRFGEIVGEEDCLYLNVFAPQRAGVDGRARPVVVWFHGGALAVGTANTYDAARDLARHDDVVVVTVNYRLGDLGWFHHPALAEADHATVVERSGNFGLLDQIAALRWVRDNIVAFGGNADCVTIFGESAGGQSVLLLLASPLAQGLFHRAIAQSPVAESFTPQEASDAPRSVLNSRQRTSAEMTARWWCAAGRAQDLDTARKEVAQLSAETLATFLRSLTPQQLLAAHAPGSAGIYLTPRVVRDGHVLPAEPLAEVFASGRWNRVPVVLGSNRDEVRTFLVDKPHHSRLLGGKLPLLRDRAAYLSESSFQSRTWRALHVDAMADAMLASGHADVWTYRFDWDELPAVPFIRPDLLLGAAHAMEIPFAFHHDCEELDPFEVATFMNRKSRQSMASAMGHAWSDFAKVGDPTPVTRMWKRRSADSVADSLIFDSERDGGVRMARAREDIEVVKRSLSDATDLSDALRCAIYARLFLWHPLFEGHGSEREYELLAHRTAHPPPATQHRLPVEI